MNPTVCNLTFKESLFFLVWLRCVTRMLMAMSVIIEHRTRSNRIQTERLRVFFSILPCVFFFSLFSLTLHLWQRIMMIKVSIDALEHFPSRLMLYFMYIWPFMERSIDLKVVTKLSRKIIRWPKFKLATLVRTKRKKVVEALMMLPLIQVINFSHCSENLCASIHGHESVVLGWYKEGKVEVKKKTTKNVFCCCCCWGKIHVWMNESQLSVLILD